MARRKSNDLGFMIGIKPKPCKQTWIYSNTKSQKTEMANETTLSVKIYFLKMKVQKVKGESCNSRSRRGWSCIRIKNNTNKLEITWRTQSSSWKKNGKKCINCNKQRWLLSKGWRIMRRRRFRNGWITWRKSRRRRTTQHKSTAPSYNSLARMPTSTRRGSSKQQHRLLMSRRLPN